MNSADAGMFQFLTENSVDVICRLSLDLKILYVSPSCTRILGWQPEELIGRGLPDLTLGEDLPLIAAAHHRAEKLENGQAQATVRNLKKDGSTVWMEINGRIVKDAVTGAEQEVVLVMREISERKQMEERLLALALTDGLTGLQNRRAFDEALLQEWKRVLREGSQVSMLMVDLDHFKALNDEYGHMVGDDCLRIVAAAVKAAVRATDMVARYGGEEIAVILPHTDPEGAAMAGEKVRSAIESLRIPHSGNPEAGGCVTASVGVATAMARWGGSARMPDTLMVSADNALYIAKREGRNCVRSFMLMAAADEAVAS